MKCDANDSGQMNFDGSLGQYKILKTKDKTYTLFSEAFNEACHSLDGAWDETLFNYLEGCRIPEKSKEMGQRPLSILEVGFGPGVGLQVVSDFYQKGPGGISFYFTSLEIDRGLVEWSMKNWPSSLPPLEGSFLKMGELSYFKGQCGLGKVLILIGNARETLKMAHKLEMIPEVHAIFQDPFSPKRNPLLWTVEWFKELKEMSSKDVTLSTYSSSTSVRKSLQAAGWFMKNAPGFSSKRTSTRAFLKGPSDQDVLDKLERAPINPLRDYKDET